MGEAGPLPLCLCFLPLSFLIFFQGKLGTSVPTGLPYGLQTPATPRDSLVPSLERSGRGASSLRQAWDVAQCRKLSTARSRRGGGGAEQPERKEFPGLEKRRKAVQPYSSPGPVLGAEAGVRTDLAEPRPFGWGLWLLVLKVRLWSLRTSRKRSHTP